MSSSSIVDYLAEKFYSYSSKMRGDSLHCNVSSFLMSGNSSVQQYDLSRVLGEVQENILANIETSPDSPLTFNPLLRSSGILSALKSISAVKPSYLLNGHSDNLFSPHLFNLVLDSYRYKSSIDPLTILLPTVYCSTPKDSYLGVSHKSKTDNDMKHTSNSSTVEAKVPIEVNHSPTAKKSGNKCDISHSVKLNLELTHRKTKEMSKRSKKRRRRQKKIKFANSCSTSSASDDDDDDDLPSPVTSSVCLTAKTRDLGCTFSVEHTVQMSPCKSSFVLHEKDDDSDELDWETIEEEEPSNTDSNGISSSDSSPIKCSSSPSKYSVKLSSSLISFVVPDSDSCDDDSDWDCCETDSIPENAGLEFTGLFITNLCVPQIFSSQGSGNSAIASDEECAEVLQLRADLLRANKNWNEHMKEVDKKPKSVPKVKFLPDEELVVVHPADVCERKGEWEMYALERLRFKRKIEELEKVLSPCFKLEHRSKIFKKLHEPDL